MFINILRLAFKVIAYISVYFVIIQHLTVSYDARVDGHDKYGFPLRYCEEYYVEDIYNESSEFVSNYNYFYLFLDILIYLIVIVAIDVKVFLSNDFIKLYALILRVQKLVKEKSIIFK